MIRTKYVPFFIIMTGLIYGMIIYILPKEAFWITDGGNKFIQVKNIALSGFGDFSIPYPAKDLDPELTFFPYCGHHFQKIGDKIYSFYPFYFPLISFFFYHFFGIAGIYVLPLLSSTLCLIVTYLILRQLNCPDQYGIAVPILGFCTPIFFYSLTFWEHSLAMMLSTSSLFLILKSRQSRKEATILLFAGLLMALSTILREEGYILLFSIVVSFIFSFHPGRNITFLSLGWLAIMIPIWILQHNLFGHCLGLHAAVYSSALSHPGSIFTADNVLGKLSNFFVYLFKFNSNTLISLLLTIPHLAAFTIGFLCATSTNWGKPRIFILVATSITTTILSILLLANDSPVFNTLFTQSLLPSTPFIILFILYSRTSILSNEVNLKFLATMSLIFIIATCLLLNQRDIGIIWGPRHFISLYPIFVPLSLLAVHTLLNHVTTKTSKKLVTAAVASLLVVSFVIQAHGVRILHLKKTSTKQIISFVKSLQTEIIVTDVYWLPEELASIYYDKKILMVRSDEHLQSLLSLFRMNNIRHFSFITSEYYGRISKEALHKMAGLVEDRKKIHSSGVEFMELMVLCCKL